jgi:hypothetical protein
MANIDMLTTLPNELTATVDPERLLVLLTEASEFETWLSERG